MNCLGRNIICLFSLLCGIGNSAFSQYYSTGQDASSLHWKQIKTARYQLIFPESFEKKAQYLANVMDLCAVSETTTLSAKVPRIPIILHTQSTTSNGLTTWAPKRIELYPCPPQVTYSEEWLEQLVIHEYRHAVQISKMNQGFTRILYYILGEQATGGMLGLFIPSWFLEGDATITETTLSKSGRGRSAIFESELRAQLLEKGKYSYDKAVLGSYKTFTPNSYMLGYHLVGQARKEYGTKIWEEALDRSAKYPFMVVPFSSGIHKVTGLTKTKLYSKTMDELTKSWKVQSDSIKETPYTLITKPDRKNHTYYIHPLFINDSTIMADKSCMDDIDRFVLIDTRTGKEQIFITPGAHIGGTTSISGDMMVWSEQEPDPRWENKDYAEIKGYNFKTGKIKDLTHETRYFAPILSPDGAEIAAVRVSEDNLNTIDILETETGKIVKSFPIENYAQAITPNWSPDKSKIIFTYLDNRGETIATLDIRTGRLDFLLPFTFNEFTGPTYYFENYIVFSIDLNGIENIYSMDTLTSQIYQVSSAQFASFDPDFSSDKRQMVFSEYTSDGLMVAMTEVDPSKWTPLEKVKDFSIKLYKDLSKQDNFNIQDSVSKRRIYKLYQSDKYGLISDTIDAKIYPVSHYSKAGHLFNPHSWAPVAVDIENITVNPGVSILSQNSLSTAFTEIGYKYDLNEEAGMGYAKFTYAGWYPVLDFEATYGKRSNSLYVDSTRGYQRFTWKESKLGTSVSIPWNFNHGKFYRSLTPVIGTTLIFTDYDSIGREEFQNGMIQTLDFSLSGSQYLHWTMRDMNPRWGQALSFSYKTTPFSKIKAGSIFALNAHLYFPGIFRHHSFWCYGGFQQRDDKVESPYYFSNLISFPRGYSGIYEESVYSLKFNYKLPLFCPDLSLGSLIYLKRVKLNLFYDYAQGNSNSEFNVYNSTGAEITADFHFLRFLAPFDMGVRSIYFPDTQGWGFEFLYSINY